MILTHLFKLRGGAAGRHRKSLSSYNDGGDDCIEIILKERGPYNE